MSEENDSLRNPRTSVILHRVFSVTGFRSLSRPFPAPAATVTAKPALAVVC